MKKLAIYAMSILTVFALTACGGKKEAEAPVEEAPVVTEVKPEDGAKLIIWESEGVEGYFDGIPKSLDEAARIDGAGHLTIFWKVIMPLAKPILVLVALTNFTGPWFDFIFPKLILRSKETKTLAIGIFEWVQGRADNNFTLFAAGSILIAIPIIILFGVLQKHIVEGLSAGATKG